MPESTRGPGRPARATDAEKLVVENTEVPAVTQVTTTNDSDVSDLLAELRALKAKVNDLEEAKVSEEEAAEALRPKPYKKAGPGEKFLIHFVRDGLTLLGKPWYKGQELEFDPNGAAYRDTIDTTGFSILELRNDPQGQEKVLGYEFFREGPWTGKSYADIEFERLKALANEAEIKLPTKEELRSLDVKERARKRQAEPLTPTRGAPRPAGY